MTKFLSTAIALALTGAAPAFADDAHHPAAQPQASQVATPAPGSASQPSGASNAGERGMTGNSTGAPGQMPGAMSGGMMGPRGSGGAMPGAGMMGGGMMGGGMMGPGMMGGGCQDMMGRGMMGPGTMGPGMMGPGMMGPGMMGGGMMGGGMMGGGMMGPSMGGGAGPLSALDLSEDQQRRVNAIHDEVRKKHWALMGEILDGRAKLRDLYSADKRDPAVIGAEYQRIFDLRRQMIEAGISAHNRVEEVLSAEQRQRTRDLMRRGYGMGG